LLTEIPLLVVTIRPSNGVDITSGGLAPLVVEVHDTPSAMLDDKQHVSIRREAVGTAKKSIAARASLWLRKNAIQRFTLSGSAGRRGM